MRLADDTRARVPFALVGILLLVGSAAFSATLSTRGAMHTDRAADRAMQRVTADAATALRMAVTEAARDAALEPVTTPAATPTGSLLNESTPFRDALRLRIYVAAREHLRTVRYRHQGVVARTSLPPTPTVRSLRTALHSVQIHGVRNGTALTVTIQNVSVVAERDGRTVASDGRTTTLTVSTPVLALHDRTRTFERRLNRSPLDGPGLGRRLTAQLYPIVWARGYGQYGGAPIQNVLANRHVEMATNGGALRIQRDVFGKSDPAGRRGLRRASLHVGARDLLEPVDIPGSDWTRMVFPSPNAPGGVNRTPVSIPSLVSRDDAPNPNRSMDIEVGRTADRALSEFLVGDGDPSVRDVFRRSYRVDARLETATRTIWSEPTPTPTPPSEGWTLADTRITVDEIVEPLVGATPPVPSDVTVFSAYTRRVTLERTVRWTWERGNETVTDSAEWSDQYRVDVALVGTYAPNASAPDRATRPLFERGGVLDGPNLADVPAAAREQLLTEQGGRDDVAAAVAAGTLETSAAYVHGDRPPELDRWVYKDLSELRNHVRNVSVEVEAGEIATKQANPPALLAETIRNQRAALLDAPAQYDGVASRARTAARAAYLDRVVARLDSRATAHEQTKRAFADELARRGLGSPDELARILRATRSVSNGGNRSGNSTDGFQPVPDGAPAYLTLSSVSHDHVSELPPERTYHPLAARNRNVFTVPYGDSADAVTAPLFDRWETVRLRTAATALVAANETLEASPDGDLRARRNRLESAIEDSLRVLRRRGEAVLQRETTLSGLERHETLKAAFATSPGVGHRALAATNGTLATAIAGAAMERGAVSDPVARDRLETRLRIGLGKAARSEEAEVPQSVTDPTAARVRTLGQTALGEVVTGYAENATHALEDRWVNDALGAVPAGLPVAPVPGYWYATVNVWSVRVRGAYARFTLRTNRGTPMRPGEGLRYVRDGSVATLDVDGDGDAERLGRDDRVTFETGTTVAIAVPPGKSGVGDIGGNADERSDGWPRPACTSWTGRGC